MGKKKMITMRISEEDKKLLEKDAKEEQRTVSNLFLYCWKQWRKRRKK